MKDWGVLETIGMVLIAFAVFAASATLSGKLRFITIVFGIGLIGFGVLFLVRPGPTTG